MKLDLTLTAKHHQTQIISPALQQTLKILQMPLSELREKMELEAEENPVLDWPEDNDLSDFSAGDSQWADELDGGFDRAVLQSGDRIAEDFVSGHISIKTDGSFSPLDLITKEETFKEYLLGQLPDIKADKKTLSICRYIIESLNSSGYLDSRLQDIVSALQLPSAQVESALNLVQTMQPCGVGARNLRECLSLQVKKSFNGDANLLRIIDECLEMIAKNKIKEISKVLKVDIKSAAGYCAVIKSLQPIPSRGFNTESPVEYVIPEAHINAEQGGILIQMNDRFLPNLSISRFYEDLYEKEKDEKTHEFLHQKISGARSFLNSVSLRNETLSNVLNQIAKLQKDYFFDGTLKPMKLADISEVLGIHESTVSRAVQGKYITCKYGTIPLKSFFTTAVCTTTESENISSNQIKNTIRDLINHEDSRNPLSDSDICECLKKDDISISRRTVAKYREEMQIDSSTLRRAFV